MKYRRHAPSAQSEAGRGKSGGRRHESPLHLGGGLAIVLSKVTRRDSRISWEVLSANNPNPMRYGL